MKKILWAVIPVAAGAGLLLSIILLNLIVDALPQPLSIEIKRAQQLAIMQKQAERDTPVFDKLRRKHGLKATAVVIYDQGKTPYYYNAHHEKIALK